MCVISQYGLFYTESKSVLQKQSYLSKDTQQTVAEESFKNMATYFRAEVQAHFLSQMITIQMDIVHQLASLKYPAQSFYMLTLNLTECPCT